MRRAKLGRASAAALVTIVVATSGALTFGNPAGAATQPQVTRGRSILAGEGLEPFVWSVDAKRGLLYVPSDGSQSVSVMNLRTDVVLQVPIPGFPGDIVTDEATGDTYVADNRHFVDVLRGTKVVASIKVGDTPGGVALDPSTGLVYVTNTGDGTVSVIRGRSVVKTIDVGAGPGVLDLAPGGDVYVAHATAGTVSVISDLEVVATITVGPDPETVTVDPASGIVYVASRGNNHVYVIKGAVLEGADAAGQLPRGIVIDPRNHYAYVAEEDSDVVTILHGLDTIDSGLALPGSPMNLSVDPANGNVYAPLADKPLVEVISGDAIVGSVSTADNPLIVAPDPLTHDAYAVNDELTSYVTVLHGPRPAKITVTRPAGPYHRNAKVLVRYRCAAGGNNTVVSCAGTVKSGARLATSTLGSHQVTVTAVSGDGQKTNETVVYRVVA